MIDTQTGEIAIDGLPIKIGPRFTRRDLPSLGIEVKSQIVNEPHHSYSLRSQTIGGEEFYFVLYFFKQRLESVDFALALEGSEASLKEAHDAWLIQQTGRASHKYLWGEISSTYDVRSGTSSIVIRYSWLGQHWSLKQPWRRS